MATWGVATRVETTALGSPSGDLTVDSAHLTMAIMQAGRRGGQENSSSLRLWCARVSIISTREAPRMPAQQAAPLGGRATPPGSPTTPLPLSQNDEKAPGLKRTTSLSEMTSLGLGHLPELTQVSQPGFILTRSRSSERQKSTSFWRRAWSWAVPWWSTMRRRYV